MKRFVLLTALVLSGVFGLGFTTGCSGGGGGDPKPNPPPVVTHVTTIDPKEGTHSSPLSTTVPAGTGTSFNITVDAGYSNPVLTPMVGTIAPGVTTGTYVYSIASVNASSTVVLTATKDPPPPATYSISGRVTGADNVLVTLLTQDGVFISSTTTNADATYIFLNKVLTGNWMLKVEKFGYIFSPTYRNVGVNNADSTGNDFAARFAYSTAHLAIAVFTHDNTGSPNNLVVAGSVDALPLGMVIEGFVKMPGKSSFTQTYGPHTVDSSTAGMLGSIQLHGGVPFYNTDGTPASSGIATYMIKTTLDGVTTSVTAEVAILMGTVLLGPLQQINKLSNGDLELVGSFPDPPIVMLITNSGYTVVVATPYGQNYVVTVPTRPDYSGPLAAVTVLSGLVCSTKENVAH